MSGGRRHDEEKNNKEWGVCVCDVGWSGCVRQGGG